MLLSLNQRQKNIKEKKRERETECVAGGEEKRKKALTTDLQTNQNATTMRQYTKYEILV